MKLNLCAVLTVLFVVLRFSQAVSEESECPNVERLHHLIRWFRHLHRGKLFGRLYHVMKCDSDKECPSILKCCGFRDQNRVHKICVLPRGHKHDKHNKEDSHGKDDKDHCDDKHDIRKPHNGKGSQQNQLLRDDRNRQARFLTFGNWELFFLGGCAVAVVVIVAMAAMICFIRGTKKDRGHLRNSMAVSTDHVTSVKGNNEMMRNVDNEASAKPSFISKFSLRSSLPYKKLKEEGVSV